MLDISKLQSSERCSAKSNKLLYGLSYHCNLQVSVNVDLTKIGNHGLQKLQKNVNKIKKQNENDFSNMLCTSL